jgi:hypothetical protein
LTSYGHINLTKKSNECWGWLMTRLSVARISLLFLGIVLGSCASVDQFGSRIYDGNVNSHDASNQETLLNVLRISKHQSPTFVAISQIAGGQAEALSTGLPTVTLGPHQTALQQTYAISNSLSSTVTSSYQANPIITTSFQEGMLFPVSFKDLALLIGSHPREIVYHAVIDSITVSHNGRVALFRNHPHDNDHSDSDVLGQAKNYNYTCDDKLRDTNSSWSAEEMFENPDNCNYAKFVRWLQLYDDYGFTAELVPSSSAGAAPSPGTNTVNTPTSSNTQQSPSKIPESGGKLCFDPTLGSSRFTTGSPQLRCDAILAKASGGASAAAGSSSARGSKSSVKFSSVFEPYGKVTLEFIKLRSPLGVFQYVGEAWGTTDDVPFLSDAANQLKGPLIDIVEGSGPGCLATAVFEGRSWCVPADAEKTAVLFDILQELRNLNVQPSDLNSAFTVRVSD